jgi:hypothetical protein
MWIKADMIAIYLNNVKITECESVIIIPEKAISEPGYIVMHTTKDSANAKHEYHAMTQMAYFQYQDDELEFEEVDAPLRIVVKNEGVELESGMILYRKENGDFQAVIHKLQNKKKLLETGYRYCTRWVRLDI